MSAISMRRAEARRRKFVAIAAAGAVFVGGATVTSLAAWVDEEWVTAGVDGAPGVLASAFEVEQTVATDAGTWFDRETAGGAGVVDFDDVAAALSPGEVAYGWVSLRAAAASLGGDLALVSGYTLGDSVLGYAGTGSELVAPSSALTTGSGGTTFALAAGTGAAPGAAQTVCFRLELPSGASGALMGETADVTWFFDAIST
jgi:hypothetical protein